MDKIAGLGFSSCASSSKKLALKQITLDLTQDEAENLENYCLQTGKAVTNVIEELIQQLSVT